MDSTTVRTFMDPRPVPKIGRYEILRLLGEGAYGSVYLALDPLIGRRVAIKSIPQLAQHLRSADSGGAVAVPDDGGELLRRRLLHEARSAGVLSHPGIVTVHDVLEEHLGGIAIAMEYVAGQSLRRRLAGPEPVSFELVADWIRQIAEALDYAHGKGIVHRDLKPANLLLDDDGRIKITDFGIAAVREDAGTDGADSHGTPAYVAPERLRGEPADHRVDLWALGVVLYELLTRHRPFRGDTVAELTRAIVERPYLPPAASRPDLPAGLAAILARALEKDPRARYQSAGDLASDLAAVVTTQARLTDTRPLEIPPSAVESAAQHSPQLEEPAVAVDEPPASPAAPAEPIAAATPDRPRPVAAESGGESLGAEPVASPSRSRQALALAARLGLLAWAGMRRGGSALRRYVPPALAATARGGRWLGRATMRTAARLERAAQRLPVFQESPFLFRALAIAVLVVAVTALGLALAGGGGETAPAASADTGGDTGRIAALLRRSEALAARGEWPRAFALAAEAEALAPEDSRFRRLALRGRWRAWALARAVDRAEVSRLGETAAEALAAGELEEAGRTLAALLDLAPDDGRGRELMANLSARRQAALRARIVRATPPEAEPPPPVPVAPAEPAPRVAAAPPPEPPSRFGTLGIAVASELPRGVVTIYRGDEQIFRRAYHFTEKKGFLRRKGVSGSFEDELRLEAGELPLRVYVSGPSRPAVVTELAAALAGGDARTLRIEVGPEGGVAARLD